MGIVKGKQVYSKSGYKKGNGKKGRNLDWVRKREKDVNDKKIDKWMKLASNNSYEVSSNTLKNWLIFFFYVSNLKYYKILNLTSLLNVTTS